MRISVLAIAVAIAGGIVAVVPWVAPATGATCSTGVAATNAFGAATGWTEFVAGDGSRGSESEGAIAYGGHHSAGGMTVGTRLPSGFAASSPALVVAGSHGTYNLQRGSAYLAPRSGVNFNGGSGTGYLASNPVDFGSAFAQLRGLSASWGAAAANGTVTAGVTGGNDALILTGTDPSLNVFDLSTSEAALIAAGRHVGYDVPAGATTIINVPGASVSLAGQMWVKVGGSWQQANDSVMASFPRIVWNFPEATTVTMGYGSAWGGHLLAPSAAVTIASVGHTIGQVIAASFVSNFETHQNLFPADACVPGPPTTPGTSDVTVTKSASAAAPRGGDTITYTLKATNVGSATATGVVMRDELPSGVTFVSAPSCSYAGGVVRCSIGSLAAGGSATRSITVTANPIAGAGASSDPQATHWLTPYKAEVQVDLEAGQQRTVALSCHGGDLLSDGQFRVDHVDQGTGTIRDVKVLSARSDSEQTWKGVIRNDATGRAQAKAFIVCLPRQTEAAGGHKHALSVDSAAVSTTGSYAVGRSTASVTCPTGTVPVAPGFDLSSASAELVGSETSSGAPRRWTFTLDVTASVTATFTARCLRTTVDAVGGHTHQLRLTHVVRTVSVPGATAAEGNEYQVICPDDAKGVVATFSLPPGVHTFGNDPRLKARAFRLFSDTGAAQDATVDLVCLHDRTRTEQTGTPTPVEVVNTATVSSTSVDANAANNAASTTVTVQPGSVTASASGLLVVRGAKAKATVVSSMKGQGQVRLKVGKKVVARGKVKLRAGHASTAKLELGRQLARKVRKAGTVRVVVDPAKGRTVTTRVKVRR